MKIFDKATTYTDNKKMAQFLHIRFAKKYGKIMLGNQKCHIFEENRLDFWPVAVFDSDRPK